GLDRTGIGIDENGGIRHGRSQYGNTTSSLDRPRMRSYGGSLWSAWCVCRTRRVAPGSVNHHRADALAGPHHLEALVDVFEPQRMGDHRIDLDLAAEIPVDDLGHIGASLGAAKGRAHPGTTGDQLERTGGNFLPRPGHADHHRLAPAAMAGFERLTHNRGVTGAVESVIGAADQVAAPFGQVDQIGHDIALDFAWIDEMGHAEALAPGLLVI